MSEACEGAALGLIKTPETTRYPINGTAIPGTEAPQVPLEPEPSKA